MAEEAKINFYSINRCGYYRHGVQSPEFGGVAGILAQLHTWATRPGFPLASTCTFAVGENGDSLRTFCFDILPSNITGDYFLTTWNETPTNQGKVPSVSANQPVGSAQVHLNDIVEGTIPGYATYFWFIPEFNKFATIKFHHILNGQQNLVKFMNGFIERHSNHVVINQIDDDNAEIAGYRQDNNSAIEPLSPSFRSQLLRKAGELELIRQRRASIRKVIRKSVLDMEIEEERSLLQRMLQKIGISNNEENVNNSLNVKYSFPLTPTHSEIDAIIEFAIEEGLTWTNDVGFQMVGKNDVVWLSNSIVKHEINLDIERDNDEIVNLQSLAEQLTTQRNIIANILNEMQ